MFALISLVNPVFSSESLIGAHIGPYNTNYDLEFEGAAVLGLMSPLKPVYASAPQNGSNAIVSRFFVGYWKILYPRETAVSSLFGLEDLAMPYWSVFCK